jgi:hypothetical protein
MRAAGAREPARIICATGGGCIKCRSKKASGCAEPWSRWRSFCGSAAAKARKDASGFDLSERLTQQPLCARRSAEDQRPEIEESKFIRQRPRAKNCWSRAAAEAAAGDLVQFVSRKLANVRRIHLPKARSVHLTPFPRFKLRAHHKGH